MGSWTGCLKLHDGTEMVCMCVYNFIYVKKESSVSLSDTDLTLLSTTFPSRVQRSREPEAVGPSKEQ